MDIKMKTKPILSLLLAVMLLAVLSINAQSDDLLWKKNANNLYSFRFSNDSRFLTYDTYGIAEIKILDVVTGQLVHTIQGQKYPRFTHDGRYLASVNDSILTLWNVGSWTLADVRVLKYNIGAYEFSNGDSIMAYVSGDKGILVYETKNWNLLKQITDVPVVNVPNYPDIVGADYISIAFDAKKIAYANHEGTFIYDFLSDTVVLRRLGTKPKFSPVRNELLIQRITKYQDKYYPDGCDLYNFDIGPDPLIKLDPSITPIDGKFDNNYSPDGNFIILSGGGTMKGNVLLYKINFINNQYEFEQIFSGTVNIDAYFKNGIISPNNKYVCSGISSLFMFQVDKYTPVIEFNNNTEEVQIIPNPSENKIKILFNDMDFVINQIIIRNLDGSQIIYKDNFNRHSDCVDFSIEFLASGTYFISLIGPKQTITQKLIINR
jgi:hypothetical protein